MQKNPQVKVGAFHIRKKVAFRLKVVSPIWWLVLFSSTSYIGLLSTWSNSPQSPIAGTALVRGWVHWVRVQSLLIAGTALVLFRGWVPSPPIAGTALVRGWVHSPPIAATALVRG